MTFRRNSLLPLVNPQMLFPGALLNSSQNFVINLWGCNDFPQDCRTGGWNIRMRGSPDPDIFPTGFLNPAAKALRHLRTAHACGLSFYFEAGFEVGKRLSSGSTNEYEAESNESGER